LPVQSVRRIRRWPPTQPPPQLSSEPSLPPSKAGRPPPAIDAKVVRVRRAETIAHPEIRRLILAAVEAVRYPGSAPEAIYDELRGNVASDLLGLFVGFQDGAPKALAGAVLPSSAVAFAPQVFIVYSVGKPDLMRAVGERVKAWIMAAGYGSVTGVGLRHSARAWMRGLGFLGETKELGSVIECRF
jgi:hypothetical protein